MPHSVTRWFDIRRSLSVGFIALFTLAVSAAGYAPAPAAMELGIMQGWPVPKGNRVTLTTPGCRPAVVRP